ncbi:MAG: sulfatase [Planctomycetota bacterium]|jgi:N-sulfoglucosamine sulfohydrolase|nr:sulfatase [Planctomycetota bacterium]
MSKPTRPNILLITADDLNWDSLGCYGCAVESISPNIDRLAAEGMRFTHGHVNVAVCMPSRSVLATGRYPHRNGIEGFRDSLIPGTRRIMEVVTEAGYRTGVLGKVGHSSAGFDQWDYVRDIGDLGRGRDCDRYREYLGEFFDQVGDEPFYMMANSHDPHRPFYGSAQETECWGETTKQPSRVYQGHEVPVPGFLPELPEVRQEMGEYYSSVRRCDDIVGAILEQLEASGHADNTLVLFLSDNGMALPFAKTNCYLHSTQTPWIMRLPGVTQAGTVDDQHFVSGVDWYPTVCELIGVETTTNLDGHSMLGLLRGDTQDAREVVHTQFHETAGRKRFPMRCVQNQRFGYIFSPWSNGERRFRNESMSGRSFDAMEAAAKHDPAIAARVDLFLLRVREELYDFAADPDALNNLIDDPAHADTAQCLRSQMHDWMQRFDDPLLSALEAHDDAQVSEDLVAAQQSLLDGLG